MDRQFAEAYEGYVGWHWWFRGRQRILESALRREIGSSRSLSIASVGCGPPNTLTWLTPFTEPGGRLVGLDADPSHASPKSSLNFVVGRLEASPLTSRSFDVLLALDVLEHLDNDVLGLREAARMAKPGGLIVVTVPALPWLWGNQDIINHHRKRYTERSLRRVFSDARLPSPRVTYFNTLLFPPIAVMRCLRSVAGSSRQPRSDFDGARPGIANEILAAVFSLERWWVGRIPMPIGVSLLAAVRV